MIAIPAIDIRDGFVVQLVGGDYAREQVRLEHPREVLRKWTSIGFGRVHVVDLDAATDRGSNRETICDLLAEDSAQVQVGGGIRTTEDVQEILSEGARWVVVGTRAVEEPRWLEEVANANPDAVIVAVDVRERRVVSRGWQRSLPLDIHDMVRELSGIPLAGLLVTAVHCDGQMKGTDLPLMEDVADESEWPVFASGGITTLADMRALHERGVAGAVLGMALYTGTIDSRILAEEFAR